MRATRRLFLKTVGLIGGGMLMPVRAFASGFGSDVNISQLVYPGGNWQPRPTALRRLSWELHKRTSLNTDLEPAEIKPSFSSLATTPLVYLSGDRAFPTWQSESIDAMSRFIKLGGTLIVDPAYSSEDGAKGFNQCVDDLLNSIMPQVEEQEIPSSHVLYRAFYQISRPMGRVLGSPNLKARKTGKRLAVIRTDHDLGAAWARDNLGSWEFDVVPGGENQRETAFRLGINLVMYAVCQYYKDEAPHRRFASE